MFDASVTLTMMVGATVSLELTLWLAYYGAWDRSTGCPYSINSVSEVGYSGWCTEPFRI